MLIRNMLVILCKVTVLVVCCCTSIFITGCSSTLHNPYRVKATIAVVRETSKDLKVEVYDIEKNTKEIVIQRKNAIAPGLLLGFDSKSDQWLFNASEKIVALGARNTKIILEERDDLQLDMAALSRGQLCIPRIKNGQVAIAFLDLDGKTNQIVNLDLGKSKASDLSEWEDIEPISISSDGSIAVTLYLSNTKKSCLYLFDKNGHLKKIMKYSSKPSFSPNGKMLAYQNDKNGNIVIADADTNEQLYQLNIARGCMEYYWSNDGNWLLVSCDESKLVPQSLRELYAIQVMNKHRRIDLPLTVEDTAWTVVRY